MEYDGIEKLLEKYFAGETSLEEERLLKNRLAAAPGEDRLLRAAAAQMEFFSGERNVRFPSRRRYPYLRRIVYALSAAAAIVAVIIALTHTASAPESSGAVYCYVNGVPVTDRDAALAQAQISLSFVAESVDAAISRIMPLVEMEDAAETIREARAVMESIEKTINKYNGF